MTSAAHAIRATADATPHPEEQYLDLLRKLLTEGVYRPDRTKTGTYSIFGHQMRFDLAKGFPLLTTKRIFFKGAVHEMLWFLSGSTNIRFLQENGVTIWDEWADENGELGPVYGKQWRAWETKDGRTVDQVADLVEGLRNNPYSRRHMISSWNVGELSAMSLVPCAFGHTFYVAGSRLSGLISQRSADSFLGLGWNLCAGALVIHMLAQQCDLEPGELVWQGADVHLYRNHRAQAEQQLRRTPRPFPQLKLRRRPPSIFDYKYEDFELVGYDPHPTISAPVAV
jgi:thymidylate synthase